MTPEEILAEHVVDIRRIAADFRDTFENWGSCFRSQQVLHFSVSSAEKA